MHVDYEAYFIGYIRSISHYLNVATMVRSQKLEIVGYESLMKA